MLIRALLLLFTTLASGSAFAQCDAMPWKFGMSPSEVAAIKECGPYKSFSNGDLETYAGIFNGKEENFQFFFQDGKLRRIGIYLHESQDSAAGVEEWLALYQTLVGLFGDIETPGNVAPQDDSSRAAFKAKALETVQSAGKTQMAPLTQPKDAFVFSSFMRKELGDENHYYVVLYFDARP